MLSIIFTIFLLWVAFKITGLIFKICGKIIGGIFGLIGYLLIGVLAIAGFGLAIAFVPIIIIVGIIAVVVCASSV